MEDRESLLKGSGLTDLSSDFVLNRREFELWSNQLEHSTAQDEKILWANSGTASTWYGTAINTDNIANSEIVDAPSLVIKNQACMFARDGGVHQNDAIIEGAAYGS